MGIADCVLRFDGGVGCHPSNVSKCRAAGLDFVSRSARYDLLEQPAVQDVLRNAQWLPVRDSGSGPRREALDIGVEHAGRPDEIRMILTRFPNDKKKRGAGCMRDGYQFELFGTSLSQDGWSPAEITTFYYGRCGQENRFFQEDRELKLDYLFSENLGGQLLATLVGMFLWNVQTIRASNHLVDFEEDSAPHLKQSESAMDDHVLEVLVDEVSNTEPASHHLEDLLDEVPSSTEQACDPVNVCVELALDRRTPTSEGGSAQVASLIALPTLVLLSLLNWSLLLKHLPDWRWDPSRGLVCPNGNILPSRGIPDITAESLTVRFRARAGTCDKCPLRSSCSTSRQAKFRKELGWKLPLSSLGMDISSEHVPDTPFPEEFPIWTKPNSLPKVAGRITGPHFIPSEFRKAHREAAADLEVWVELALPADLRKPVWRVDDDAARQHRRNTWGRRRLANSLPANATLKVQYQMSDPDKKWISSITGSGA